MANIDCLLCISEGIMFILRIIVMSVGNKVGRQTWLLMVSSCQAFVRLIGSVETEWTSGELLIELLLIELLAILKH